MKKAGINLLAAGCIASAFAIQPAVAELGDYPWWQTGWNLIFPPAANNPVSPEQQLPPYPLLTNEAGFNDGFRPGLYGFWQTVKLDRLSTGAMCGNGSEYKFFVNRVPHTSNTIIYMEGGGNCSDYESCSNAPGVRGWRNADGIPDDYMSLFNPAAKLASPFIVRLHPFTRTKVQAWNMVYIPYCTADVYSGDKTTVYENEDRTDFVTVHHNGVKNMRAVKAWLKNNLQRPAQMFVTGCSAGGVSSASLYHLFRRDMEPTKSFMLDDSGPILSVPLGGDVEQYPAIPLFTDIREKWGMDQGLFPYLAQDLNGFDANNIISLYGALSAKYPNDRMGQTHFWEDLNFSGYAYERVYEDIINAPDEETRKERILARWEIDTNHVKDYLSQLENVGYFLPRFRDFNESHCSTIIDFADSDIQEDGLEMRHFVDNILDGSGRVMEASEEDRQADHQRTSLIYQILNWFLGE